MPWRDRVPHAKWFIAACRGAREPFDARFAKSLGDLKGVPCRGHSGRILFVSREPPGDLGIYSRGVCRVIWIRSLLLFGKILGAFPRFSRWTIRFNVRIESSCIALVSIWIFIKLYAIENSRFYRPVETLVERNLVKSSYCIDIETLYSGVPVRFYRGIEALGDRRLLIFITMLNL